MAYYSYLIRNSSGTYYFRIKIPPTNQPEFNNRSEVRRSLKTRDKREAVYKAQHLASLYLERFSTVSIKRRINHIKPVGLDNLSIETINLPSNFQPVASSGHLLSACIKTYLENIKTRNPEKAEFHIKEKKPIFERLLEIVGDKNIEEISFLDASHFFATLQRLPSNLRKFFINQETINEVLSSDKIQTLTRMSPRTVNKYLENVTTLFRFFVQNGVLSQNVFENKNLRAIEKTRACDRRQRFSPEDLKAIFETGKYFNLATRNKFFKESYYWVTLLALYTGARVTEISQLHVNDILQIEGIWCISLTENLDVTIDNFAYKSLKNKSSCRLIPLHDQLLELGFLKFVQNARKKKAVRLFADITKKKKGVYGGIVGGWFNKNKARYFNITNPKQSFHSFRHTFIDTLKQSGVGEELVAVVVGHARKSITFNVYGKDYSVKYIKEGVLDKLNYNLFHQKY